MALGDTARRLDPLELASHGPVIPVIVIERAEDAVPMARALFDGGVRVLEVTLRTPAALAAIAAIAQSMPDVIVGAGTVRSDADARAALAAGARFAVSPGFSPRVAAACREIGLRAAARRGDGERGDARRRSTAFASSSSFPLPPPAARRC